MTEIILLIMLSLTIASAVGFIISAVFFEHEWLNIFFARLTQNLLIVFAVIAGFAQMIEMIHGN